MMIKKNTEGNPVVGCGLYPLCGGQNYCEASSGVSSEVNSKINCEVNKESDCWCRSETFTEQLLPRVPDDRQQKACICQNCVRAFADASFDEGVSGGIWNEFSENHIKRAEILPSFF